MRRAVLLAATVVLAGCESAADLGDPERFQVPARQDQAWVLAGEDSRPAGNVVCVVNSGGRTTVTVCRPCMRKGT